jgi:hypothetical protein
MILRALVVAAMIAAAAAAKAQTPEHLAAVERAAAVGWDLYEHDQAAWHGTDRMLEAIRDPRAEGLSGWITERTPDGVQVLFLKAEGGRVAAAYRALYRDGEVREHGRIDQPLTETQARIDRARRIAIAAPLPQQCAQRYNTVTLPRAEPGADGVDVDVYLMPAMATNDEVPFGGHFRFAVDTTAGVVRETQRFTNSCLTLPRDERAAGLYLTQLIGDTPTEVHVFESLTVGMPVFVGARSGIWAVEGRAIRYLEPPPAN